jgi:CheY-like chemotaxis protein/HPt (histidine-containing phosphotransfer) domain-containing protein
MMLTSAGLRGDAARCRELGIAGYLTKPITQPELWEAIRAVLGRQAETTASAPLVTRHSIREHRQTLHILLAEDNPVNQKLAVHLLEKQGHAVIAVRNGREALTALAQQPVDLVLMDVQMPEMDGLEATAAIRGQEQASGAHVPILAMTGYAMQGDRERCLAAGMDGYITKPIRATELYGAIERLLQDAPKPDTPAVAPPIDLPTAVSNLDGDSALLAAIVEVFRQDYPKQLGELREAIGNRDAARTDQAAHTLKGSLGHLAAQKAYDLAFALETMGRRADLNEAPSVLQQLEHELERIITFVAEPGWERQT